MDTVKIVEESTKTIMVFDKALEAMERAIEDGECTEIYFHRDDSHGNEIPLVICVGPMIRKT
jgi:hypothetical protein